MSKTGNCTEGGIAGTTLWEYWSVGIGVNESVPASALQQKNALLFCQHVLRDVVNLDPGSKSGFRGARIGNYLVGVRVKDLMATPYCGGLFRENRRTLVPAFKGSVTG